MNYRELSEIYQQQIKVLMKTIESLRDSARSQNNTIESLHISVDSQSKTIESLTQEISELKKIILEKDKGAEKLVSKLNGVSKIALPKKIERRNYSDKSLAKSASAPTPKERGNNGAKRKQYHDIEEIIEDVEPTHPEFNASNARLISHVDVIRYEYLPQRLIKHVYRCKKYSSNDTVYCGSAPITPFLNSNFDSSVLANMIQLRYVYGMPIERIVRQYAEMGFDIPKQTAHGLLTKAASMLNRLYPILKETVLSDTYIHFDETYHTVLDKTKEKGSRKAYFWSALSSQLKLLHFFYSDGSRAKEVFTSYLPQEYMGAIQCDGYSTYKVLDGWDYPSAIRLGCVQHCKRKFLEIDSQKEAKEIIDIYNEFYQIRKKHKKDKWIELSLKAYDKLENRLRKLEKAKECLTNSLLSKAVAYAINELSGIYNIISSDKYRLDNNDIERPMRYISWSRKNSMFCGSGKSAERLALIYSLAISCRLNNINSFEYFCDIINRIAQLHPRASKEQLRERSTSGYLLWINKDIAVSYLLNTAIFFCHCGDGYNKDIAVIYLLNTAIFFCVIAET